MLKDKYLDDHPAYRVIQILSCGHVSQVVLVEGHDERVVAKYSTLARVRHEVAVLQYLLEAGGAPMVRAISVKPHYSPRFPRACYSFLMTDRGHVSLHHLAQHHHLDHQEVLLLTLDVARCLTEIHARDVVHNNVHAENVVLRADPRGSRGHQALHGRLAASVINFALSRRKGEPLTLDWLQDGQQQYLAPELMLGKACQPAADVFSLGKLLEWLMTRHWADYPPVLRLITDMTQIPQRRRPTLPKVIQRLEALLDIGLRLPGSSVFPGLSKWLRGCTDCVVVGLISKVSEDMSSGRGTEEGGSRQQATEGRCWMLPAVLVLVLASVGLLVAGVQILTYRHE